MALKLQQCYGTKVTVRNTEFLFSMCYVTYEVMCTCIPNPRGAPWSFTYSISQFQNTKDAVIHFPWCCIVTPDTE